MRTAGSSILVLLAALVLFAAPAQARVTPYDFKLTQRASECKAPGSYDVSVAWKPTAESSTFAIATGNTCRLKGKVCAKRSPCMVTCRAGGTCEAHLNSCVQGRGSPWLSIQSTASKTQHIATAAPRRCLP